MDICADILNQVEIKNADINNDVFNLVLLEFLNRVDEKFEFINCETTMAKVLVLKNDYIYLSKYIKLFFEVLEKYNYNMRQEIKDAMFALGHLEKPNANKELIKKLTNSPVIKDISFNGKNEFVISSETYGDFVFELASYYFKNHTQVTYYMKNNPLPNRCHINAYFLSKIFKDFYSITALCPYYFKDTYYHSFTYDKDSNYVIDLCYNGIIDKDLYYKIFQPNDISVILNSNVEEELALTNLKTEQYFDRCDLLKIALYKQYLDSIGYKGSLEKAPYVKSK